MSFATKVERVVRKRKCHMCPNTIHQGEMCLKLGTKTGGMAEGNLCSKCVALLSRSLFTEKVYSEIVEDAL